MTRAGGVRPGRRRAKFFYGIIVIIAAALLCLPSPGTDGPLVGRPAMAAGEPLVIIASLSSGVVDTAFRQNLLASGGTPPYRWSIPEGDLPQGTALEGSTGEISGTPVRAGTFRFVAKVGDAEGATTSKSFTLTIYDRPRVRTASLPFGRVNVPYRQTLEADGGLPPYSWSLKSGSLPSGLALDSGKGEISGVPVNPYTYDINLQVTDAKGSSAETHFSLEIHGPPVLTTASLPSVSVGVSYRERLAATAGEEPYTWSVQSGRLPPGLALDTSQGVLSGRPSEEGTFGFVVQVTDARQGSADKPYSLTVHGLPQVTTSPLTAGRIGQTYFQTLSAAGGSAPYKWKVIEGALPPGLRLRGASGEVMGHPEKEGIFNFTVRLTDAEGSRNTMALTITIFGMPLFSLDAMPDGTKGTAYRTTLEVTGGLAPYTWTIRSGRLPEGLRLESAGGEVSGIPRETGLFEVTVIARDANGSSVDRKFLLRIYDAPSIMTSSLLSGIIGRRYEKDLQIAGGLPPYRWSLSVGELPPGLQLNGETGTISGIPKKEGHYEFAVEVSDGSSTKNVKPLFLTVYGRPRVDPDSLNPGTEGSPYSRFITARGGLEPYTWSIAGGFLPSGLVLNGTTGEISGVPTIASTFEFSLKVTDMNGMTDTIPLAISVFEAPIITPRSVPEGTVGVPYRQGLASLGGIAPFTWSVTEGNLPQGLTLDAPTGALSGTPSTGGTFDFTVQVSDSTGNKALKPYSIAVKERPYIYSWELPAGTLGKPYRASLKASGGEPPYTWSVVDGSLPSGLSLNRTTGELSGVPNTIYSFRFTVQVSDANASVMTREISVPVAGAPFVITESLPSGMVGKPYRQSLTASAGASRYSWSLTSGKLPPGLTLEGQTGRITGTPSVQGTFEFTVGVADQTSPVSYKSLSIGISTRSAYFFISHSRCLGKTYSLGPRVVPLSKDPGECDREDRVKWSYSGGPKNLLIGAFENRGFSRDHLISGEASGSALSLLSKDAPGTGYVHLVELDPRDNSVIQVLSTVSVVLDSGRVTMVKDLSGLSGRIRAGYTFGIMLAVYTSQYSEGQVRWGKTGGDPEAEQRVSVSVTSSAVESGKESTPVAVIKGPDRGVINEQIAFNGGDSQDPEGGMLSYFWNFGDGFTSEGADPSYTFSVADRYVVSLTVTNASGASHTTSKTVTIDSFGDNRPPVADAGPDKTVNVKKKLTLYGSGSYDPDGSIARYLWDMGDGEEKTGVMVSHNYERPGTYTVTLTVTDDKGAETNDQAVISVKN